MKTKILRNVVFYIFYYFVATNALTSKDSQNSANILGRLLGSESNNPLLLFVDLTRSQQRDLEDLYNQDGGESLRVGYDDDTRYKAVERNGQEEDNETFLGQLLRSVAEDNLRTSRSKYSFSETEHALRSALRSRCNRVDSCVQKCPPRKPACPMNCQQIFDDLNLCPPPPPPPTRDPCTKKPRCGRTMPPKWKL